MEAVAKLDNLYQKVSFAMQFPVLYKCRLLLHVLLFDVYKLYLYIAAISRWSVAGAAFVNN